MLGSPVLVLAQAPITVHVDGDKWWITAVVAIGAALLGSFGGAVGRERSDDQWPRDAPLLVIWRELVDDGRANTTASARVREALGRVEEATDVFNRAFKATQNTFEERGGAIVEQSGFTPDYPGQLRNEFGTLYRCGVREARIYRVLPGPSSPHRDVSR